MGYSYYFFFFESFSFYIILNRIGQELRVRERPRDSTLELGDLDTEFFFLSPPSGREHSTSEAHPRDPTKQFRSIDFRSPRPAIFFFFFFFSQKKTQKKKKKKKKKS